MNVGIIRSWLALHGRQALTAAGLALLALYVLRGCIPGLQGHGGMPTHLYNRIQERYVNCVDVYAIQPGERRQPDCGTIDIQVAGRGVVPAEQQAAGVSRALCYKVSTTNPYVDMMGSATLHDEFWKSRQSSKVTVLQNGEWLLFPDLDYEDEARWEQYSCPGAYE